MKDGIEARFASRGILWKELLLLPAPIALDFIDLCQKENVTLLGFDGFRIVTEERIQPYLEHSLDLSSTTLHHLSQSRKLELAQQFIAARLTEEGLLFEMVVA